MYRDNEDVRKGHTHLPFNTFATTLSTIVLIKSTKIFKIISDNTTCAVKWNTSENVIGSPFVKIFTCVSKKFTDERASVCDTLDCGDGIRTHDFQVN